MQEIVPSNTLLLQEIVPQHVAEQVLCENNKIKAVIKLELKKN